MTPGKEIFHPDFKAAPWWWEAWTPNNALSQDPPAKTDVVIVGAGYGGLSTALELRRNGIDAVVLERGDVRHRRLDAQRRHDLGRHQSRQGAGRQEPDRRGVRAQQGRADGRGRRFAHRAGGHHRPREASSAACTRTAASSAPGRRAHYDDLATKVETYNKYANAGARWCRASASASSSQSDYYYGGMHATRAGHLHPALYYKGLLEAAHNAGRHPVRQRRGRAHREDGDAAGAC